MSFDYVKKVEYLENVEYVENVEYDMFKNDDKCIIDYNVLRSWNKWYSFFLFILFFLIFYRPDINTSCSNVFLI